MPRRDLKGRTALVTGAARRIGRRICLALAEEGVHVIAHYRSSADEAERLREELEHKGVRCWPVQADFGRQSDTASLIANARARAGALDILVNNASDFPLNSLRNLEFDALVEAIRVNAWAPFVLMRDFAGSVAEGQIINLLDTRITGYDWNHLSYILSKHVLAVLTKMMAVELAPGITVNAVAPGLILPPPGASQEYMDRMTHTVPLKRQGDPADIAEAVICLLHTEFVTGHVMNVDGGRHLAEYTNGPHSHR
jgi:pteridine reductase